MTRSYPVRDGATAAAIVVLLLVHEVPFCATPEGAETWCITVHNMTEQLAYELGIMANTP